ncbi:uncharacterized protein PITG_13384 [Phytophthora infestans T30-4]|uniref:Tc1-like transposase DDE domain-containing protein n=1 Tax=Phytophthora infestans (strain T30-4) TaxID=403677 RepID=D0NLV0_PHYIT|nr:uncharacterized protein PITG_13384 [Phytophthora infestans T30-4]EEY60647.1 conserved hypothetical protein [Phytophthora infestans T30-4]|eukprot:XP_002900020.1 conserved hypothetical protein [Phytophthora infestans T30-4]
MHIKDQDVLRFIEEQHHVDWSHHNLVFLDEVSFNNRGMIRKLNGLIDCFDTQGTFDRVEFLKCYQDFAYTKRNFVCQYPGSHSVWILDGASIHRHPEIVHVLWIIGIVPIFLPAYCLFFNPIEYIADISAI